MLNILIILGMVLFFIFLVFYAVTIIVYAKKHKIDIAAAIDKAQAEIPLLSSVVNLLEAALPTPYRTLATSIGDMIVNGINFAEQMKDTGMLTADQRKATAMSAITAALSKEGITPDAKMLGAISDAVDIAARVLVPHSTAPVATDTAAPASPAQAPTVAVGVAQ